MRFAGRAYYGKTKMIHGLRKLLYMDRLKCLCFCSLEDEGCVDRE